MRKTENYVEVAEYSNLHELLIETEFATKIYVPLPFLLNSKKRSQLIDANNSIPILVSHFKKLLFLV